MLIKGAMCTSNCISRGKKTVTDWINSPGSPRSTLRFHSVWVCIITYRHKEKDGLKDNTSSDQSSTRTGSKCQIHNGRVLPQQVGPEKEGVSIETVQYIVERCKVQEHTLNGKPSGWDSAQEHLCRASVRRPSVQMGQQHSKWSSTKLRPWGTSCSRATKNCWLKNQIKWWFKKY